MIATSEWRRGASGTCVSGTPRSSSLLRRASGRRRVEEETTVSELVPMITQDVSRRRSFTLFGTNPWQAILDDTGVSTVIRDCAYLVSGGGAKGLVVTDFFKDATTLCGCAGEIDLSCMYDYCAHGSYNSTALELGIGEPAREGCETKLKLEEEIAREFASYELFANNEVDACTANPCRNNGTCIDVFGGYSD